MVQNFKTAKGCCCTIHGRGQAWDGSVSLSLSLAISPSHFEIAEKINHNPAVHHVICRWPSYLWSPILIMSAHRQAAPYYHFWSPDTR